MLMVIYDIHLRTDTVMMVMEETRYDSCDQYISHDRERYEHEDTERFVMVTGVRK